MLLISKGERRLEYHGPVPPGQMPPYVECQGFSLKRSGTEYYMPKCRLEIEEIPNPYGHKGTWYALKDCKIEGAVGAAKESILQWTGAAWGDSEMIVIDKGRKVLGKDGEYTLEKQDRKIKDGTIASPTVIDEHRLTMKGKVDFHLLFEIRRMIQADPELGRTLSCRIKWINTTLNWDGCYRMTINYRPTSRRFVGLRIHDFGVAVDHCRPERYEGARVIWDYSLNSRWPVYNLADPQCFDNLLDYLRKINNNHRKEQDAAYLSRAIMLDSHRLRQRQHRLGQEADRPTERSRSKG